MNQAINRQNDIVFSPMHVAMGAGMALVLVAGLVHLIEAPDNLSEAPYKGVLFIVNAVLAVIAAVGIYRNQKIWGWGLGLVVAVGSILGYIMSRTIGLPTLEVDSAWFEAMGVLSVVVEVGFVAAFLWWLAHTRKQSAA